MHIIFLVYFMNHFVHNNTFKQISVLPTDFKKKVMSHDSVVWHDLEWRLSVEHLSFRNDLHTPQSM